MFSVGKTPYPGLDPVGVVELLDTGGRLHCPHNEACSQEMYENCILNNLARNSYCIQPCYKILYLKLCTLSKFYVQHVQKIGFTSWIYF